MSFLNPTRNRKNLHFTLEGGRFAEGVKLTEQEKAFLKQGREDKKQIIKDYMTIGNLTKIQAEKAYLKDKKEMLKEKRQKQKPEEVETYNINDYLNAYNETLNPVMTPKRRGRPPTGKAKPKKPKLSPEELQQVRLSSLEKARAVRANNLLNKKTKPKKYMTVDEFRTMTKEQIQNEIKNLGKIKRDPDDLKNLRKVLKSKKNIMNLKETLRNKKDEIPLLKYNANIGEGIIRGLTNRRTTRRGGGIVESAIEAVPTLVNYLQNYKKEKQEKTNRANQMLRDMQSGKYMSDLNRQLGLQ